MPTDALTRADAALPLAGGSRGERARRRMAHALDWLFAGTVASSVYGAMRIGIAGIFLVRHADWLRPWVYLEHHRFVRGLMFMDTSALAPRLRSPLVPFLTLGDTTTHVLVYVRTGLSLLLLLGVRARITAALLALVSYLLFAADRYRYYHHLHLLYVTLFWLALAPIGDSLTLTRGLARLRARFWPTAEQPTAVSLRRASSPLWPLQLLRAQALSVYVAAAVSKLDASFLRGDALRELETAWVLKGAVWETARDALGYGGVATLSAGTELMIALGLAVRPTRRVSVLLAWTFHAGISLCMPVYSFGAQMAVLVFAFWPKTTSNPA